ncbi:P27 family phage terminase small subunit [Actinacidiphila acididurans]|uniref:P27 family phage terminase small subunit n=1 Tax=Actinacidiphila acididurans TaxID=2784346 RepID=A0ABS2TMG1_9ACTN|nr:P27 family phage terminase small subunit [Actinacidiphila acididurans]MBM9504529.1 P27 family phage terminase small subunit [Actinacidiphila acididurans]
MTGRIRHALHISGGESAMVAGRPPVPTERKRRLGNPGQRALPDATRVVEVAPLGGAELPAHLGPAGRDIWQRVVSGAVWLAQTDMPTLLLLAEKTDRRDDFLRRLADSEPVLYTEKNYAYPNPLVGMLSTVETEIAKLLAALGLTPTDRARMGLAEVKAKSAFEEMLSRRKETS